jgi:Sulfotransferase family
VSLREGDLTPPRRTPPACPQGWHTGPPDFVGIGAQRCGTSWWYGGAVRSHPLVATLPDRTKELHFFNRYWITPVEDDLADRYARFFPRPEGTITGEWTPRYMYDAWTLPLLAAVAPLARVLILLRDPIERYRSGVAHELARARRIGDTGPPVRIVNDAIARGFYYRQVKRALELFPSDRVLVLQYERCAAEPLAEMRRTQEFLGLEPLGELSPRLRQRKPSREKPALAAALRDELHHRFSADVRALAELCPQIDPARWPNFGDA